MVPGLAERYPVWLAYAVSAETAGLVWSLWAWLLWEPYLYQISKVNRMGLWVLLLLVWVLFVCMIICCMT